MSERSGYRSTISRSSPNWPARATSLPSGSKTTECRRRPARPGAREVAEEHVATVVRSPHAPTSFAAPFRLW